MKSPEELFREQVKAREKDQRETADAIHGKSQEHGEEIVRAGKRLGELRGRVAANDQLSPAEIEEMEKLERMNDKALRLAELGGYAFERALSPEEIQEAWEIKRDLGILADDESPATIALAAEMARADRSFGQPHHGHDDDDDDEETPASYSSAMHEAMKRAGIDESKLAHITIEQHIETALESAAALSLALACIAKDVQRRSDLTDRMSIGLLSIIKHIGHPIIVPSAELRELKDEGKGIAIYDMPNDPGGVMIAALGADTVDELRQKVAEQMGVDVDDVQVEED